MSSLALSSSEALGMLRYWESTATSLELSTKAVVPDLHFATMSARILEADVSLLVLSIGEPGETKAFDLEESEFVGIPPEGAPPGSAFLEVTFRDGTVVVLSERDA